MLPSLPSALPSAPADSRVHPTPAALDSLSAVRHDRVVPAPLP